MPARRRHKTKYAGVTYINGTGADGQLERIYYVTYRRNGRLIEEKAGRATRDRMSAAKAAGIRADRIAGKELPNREAREHARAEKKAEGERMTFSKLWELYEANGEAAKSIAQERCRFQRYIQPTLGDKTPGEVLPIDVDRLRLQGMKGKAPATIHKTLSLLSRLATYGKRKLGSPSLPFEVSLPRVNNEKTETLTEAQLEKLLEALREWPDRQIANLMMLALSSGMRRGELLKLRWSDLDFEGGFIRLRDPKGKKDMSIPMNSTARELLEGQPRLGAYVFSTEKGDRFHDVRKRVDKVKKAADLPADFRGLHGLRHQFATSLANSGEVDLYVLQRLLTHKSVSTTSRYAHLMDNRLKEASSTMDKILKSENSNKGNVIPLKP
jgi:integrase